MKKRIITLLISVSSILFVSGQIQHLEPPFWWAGMKNPNLQLLVHGKDISTTSVELSYEGVELRSVSKLENPNFLFLALYLSPDVSPGSFSINFTSHGQTAATYIYELKAREKGSAMREGFNNSDVMYLIMPDRFANGDPSNDIVDEMKEKALNKAYEAGRMLVS